MDMIVLVDSFPPFQHFEYIAPFSPALQGFADRFIWIPLYVMSHFSLTVFKILSLCLAFNIFIIMCLRVILFELLLFGVFELPEPECASLSLELKIFSYYFLKYAFCPFLYSPFVTSMILMVICLIVSHNSHRLSSLHHFFLLTG